MALKRTSTAMKVIAKRSMKAKKASTIARGSRMRSLVFRGSKEKTYTGLSRSDLKLSKRGKVVTKKSSAAAKKRWEGGQAQQWIRAVVSARKQLNISGFVALNSSSPQGKALYVKARAIYTGAV